MGAIYTKDEIEYILTNKATKTAEQIGKDLGRSTAAIKGIYFRKKNTYNKKQSEELGIPYKGCNYENMLKFAKSINPKYKRVTDAFKDYGVREFKKLYKSKL